MSDSVLTPPPYLSPSSIATFQQCPLKYKLSRIDGISEPPTEATLRGNFVHSVLETLYGLPAEDRSIRTARNLAKIIWDDEYQEKVAPYVYGESGLRQFRWTSWWCIENLFSMEEPSKIEFDGLETEIDDKIAGVAVKGFIDRWHEAEEGIVVGDYKTGKTPNPRYMDDKYFQLSLYACALEQKFGKQVDRIELLYIKDAVLRTKKVTDNDRSLVANTVVSVRTGIDQRCESGAFEPKTSRLCDWCFFKSQCPAWGNNH